MSIQKPSKIENFEQLNKFIQDFFNNYGQDDLRGSGIRTEAPTTDTLGKGRQAIVELSGVPYLYYLTTDGVLYKTTMTAA
jgi:hypothetical protein